MPSRVTVAVNNLVHYHIRHTAEQKSVMYKWLDPACKSQKQNSSLTRLTLAPVQHSDSSHFCTGPQDSWPGFNSPMSPPSERSSHPTVIMQISHMEPQDVIYRTCHVLLFLCLIPSPPPPPLSFSVGPRKDFSTTLQEKNLDKKKVYLIPKEDPDNPRPPNFCVLNCGCHTVRTEQWLSRDYTFTWCPGYLEQVSNPLKT